MAEAIDAGVRAAAEDGDLGRFLPVAVPELAAVDLEAQD
jgi:hypothetical protein